MFISNLQENLYEFIRTGSALESELDNCTCLAMPPELLQTKLESLVNLWDSIAGSVSCLFTLSQKSKAASEESTELIHDLLACFVQSYDVYLLSGSSGNSAQTDALCQWQQRYRLVFPEIREQATLLMKEIDDLEKQEQPSMAFVYASPEFMGKDLRPLFLDVNEDQMSPFLMTTVYASPTFTNPPLRESVEEDPQQDSHDPAIYPFLHAEAEQSLVTPGKSSPCFCLYCGRKLIHSQEICLVCNRKLPVENDPDATIKLCPTCQKGIPLIAHFCPWCGDLYGRPEPDPIPLPETESPQPSPAPKNDKSKESLFSKLFRRKR